MAVRATRWLLVNRAPESDLVLQGDGSTACVPADGIGVAGAFEGNECWLLAQSACSALWLAARLMHIELKFLSLYQGIRRGGCILIMASGRELLPSCLDALKDQGSRLSVVPDLGP